MKGIAFLRAINVGGRNVKMESLRALFEDEGFTGVETFIASGNVIFDIAVGKTARWRSWPQHIEESIEAVENRDSALAIEFEKLAAIESGVGFAAQFENGGKRIGGVEVVSERGPERAYIRGPCRGQRLCAVA